jgi:DNA-binding SARP family transcriptional activator
MSADLHRGACMESGVNFGLLGPLIVRPGDRALTISFGKQRVLLAALLARANQINLIADLADLIWDGQPPRTARVTVQNYVKRLRQALGQGQGPSLIQTHPNGYLISTRPDELDLTRFGRLCTAGLEAARKQDWGNAAECLASALSLWRGQPFADIPCEALSRRESSWLGELRSQAVEARIDADLHLGRHYQVIAELQQLIDAEPLRERLYALLMLALYRCGQQAAALEIYRRVRELLVENLGVSPGPDLWRLHQQILRAEPGLMLTGPVDLVALIGPPKARTQPGRLTSDPARGPAAGMR